MCIGGRCTRTHTETFLGWRGGEGVGGWGVGGGSCSGGGGGRELWSS